MKDYFLFIDTEASGLPRKWQLPYDAAGNWPYAVQVSWIIYTKDGERVRQQNHYVSNDDFEISPSAWRIHGLTREFLMHNGKPRRQLLEILSADLLEYQPLVIGHFMELDYRVIGADYCREGLPNPMENLPTFCVMTASRHLQQNPQRKFLRLGDLYKLLFGHPLLNQHNAMADAAATADCFFELVKRKEILSLEQPSIPFPKPERPVSRKHWLMALFWVLASLLLIAVYYGYTS